MSGILSIFGKKNSTLVRQQQCVLTELMHDGVAKHRLDLASTLSNAAQEKETT
jgi:hypothetical protein